MEFRIGWMVAFFPLFSNVSFADDAKNRNEAESLISGYMSNLEAIESFELVWRREAEWVGSDGAIESTLTIGRLILDPEKNRCMSVKHDIRTLIVPSDVEAVDSKWEAVVAVVFDGKVAWERRFPHDVGRIKPEFDKVLSEVDSPMINAIGLGGFPVTYQESGRLRRYHDWLRQGKAGFRLINGETNTPSISLDHPGETFFERIVVTLDSEKLVAKTYRCSSMSRVNSDVVPTCSESYEFQEKSHLQLPAKIIGERRRSGTLNDKSFRGTETYEVDFHWISVNEKLDDSLFEAQILHDGNQLLRLVDPSVFIKK